MNGDGSPQRTISLAKTAGCVNVSWTSDQRWVVFTLYRQNAKPALMAVEVATGQSKELRTFADDDPAPWVLDRDVVLLTENTRDGNGARRAIWQVDLTGNAKLLREIPVEDGGSVTVVDRTQAIVTRKASRDLRLIALASGEERTIAGATSGFVSPRLSLSADRQWVAFLTGADNTQLTRLELVKLDQTARRTIDLPFPADAGGQFLGPARRDRRGGRGPSPSGSAGQRVLRERVGEFHDQAIHVCHDGTSSRARAVSRRTHDPVSPHRAVAAHHLGNRHHHDQVKSCASFSHSPPSPSSRSASHQCRRAGRTMSACSRSSPKRACSPTRGFRRTANVSRTRRRSRRDRARSGIGR